MFIISKFSVNIFRGTVRSIDKPARFSEWGDSNAVYTVHCTLYGQIDIKVVNEGQQSKEEPR